jgi:hypothetical protein
MLIRDLLLTESPKEVKTWINLVTDYDLHEIRNNTQVVKRQVQVNRVTTRLEKLKVMTTLKFNNDKLQEISKLPNWSTWLKSSDGKSVSREIKKIFDDNKEFMRKLQI